MSAVTSENGFDSHLLVHFLFKSAHDRIFSIGHRYVLSGSPSIALSNVNVVATQLQSGFSAEFIAVLAPTNFYVGTHVIYYGGSTSFEGFSTGAPVDGDLGDSETLPEEDCVVIRKRTGLAGRTHRGRMFMPLVPEELQNDGRLTTDGIAAYNALAQKFKQVWNFDSTLTGLVGTPKHASWKDGTLDTIQETGVVVDVLNRRDRRDPKTLIYQASPA